MPFAYKISAAVMWCTSLIVLAASICALSAELGLKLSFDGLASAFLALYGASVLLERRNTNE